MNKKVEIRRKIITPCNDHIGGLIGEALLRYFLKAKLIKNIDDEYIITDKGWEELELIGIDIEKLQSMNRKIVNICMESNHGILYEHIGSYLGAFLMNKMIELGWLIQKDKNSYELTDKGIIGLESLGVRIKTFAF